MRRRVWIVGPGNMGREYYKILSSLGVQTEVIGRSEKVNWPTKVYSGGLSGFIETAGYAPEYAIVCTNEHNLYQNVKILIEYGVKNILVEKPAGIAIEQVERLYDLSKEVNLYVGYNRRFYQSVQKCKQIIDQSTSPVNITFEFTEWLHKIDFSRYTKEELSHFFLCNSSHVVDTVFYLAGQPKEIHATNSGALDWHPSAAVFSGSGTTERGILFNYHANWLSSGRWKIEINVAGKRLILAPLEKLFIQEKGSLIQEEVTLDNVDIDYKCGLFKQVESFLHGAENLCTIKEHYENFKFYYKIANYERAM